MYSVTAWLADVLLSWDSWKILGILGQVVFGLRFVVQWIYSEQAGRSVIPPVFWYISLIGGVITLAYGIHRRELVIMIGQLPGVFVYLRNIQLLQRENRDNSGSSPDALGQPRPRA